MENTAVFYGYYTGTFVFEFVGGMKFDFPMSYFLVIFFVYLVNLCWVVFTSTKSTKDAIQKSIELEDGNLGLFKIVFGGWDHKIRYCRRNLEVTKSFFLL